MIHISEKRFKSIKLWAILNLFESLILVLILLFISKDPKNAWLFGYSKNRVLVMGILLIYLSVFLVINKLLSRSTKKNKKSLESIQNHPSIGFIIECICGCCLIVFVVSVYYLCSILLFTKSLESIHVRIIPLVVFIMIVSFQTFIFSVYFRLVLEGKSLVLRNAIRYYTFPSIREKIYIFCRISFPSNLEKLYKYFDSLISRLSKKFSKPLLSTIFIFSPALLTFLLIFVLFKTTPFSHIPGSADQVDYWHETQTFVDYGFSGGQYGYDEQQAPAEFSRFGGHGPAIPVIYGLFGRIIGWEYYSAVLINLFLVTLALVVFLLLGNLDNKQLFCGIILLGTCWPLLLYLPTNMSESINHAIAIVISVLFYFQMTNKENDKKLALSILIILFISTMIRVTWSLLFLPFFLYSIINYKHYKLFIAFILSCVGILLGFIFTRYFYSPYPLVFEDVLAGQGSFTELFNAVATQIRINIQNLIHEADNLVFIQVFRYQIIGISVYLIYILIRYFTKGERSIKGLFRSDLSFHFLNIIIPFIGVLTLFEVVDTRDYRNLVVHFLLSILVLLLFSRYKYIYLYIVINGILIFSFLPGYEQQRDNNYIYDMEKIEVFSDSISEHIVFDESKNNRWCNSLAYMRNISFLFTIDSGIGITHIFDVSENTKSKYLLLSDEYIDSNLLKIETLGLVELEKTDIGTFYLNPNSDCE